MKKIEEILKEWEKDSVIDRTDLAVVCSNVPLLHSKYMIYLGTAKEMLRKVRFEETILNRQLTDYYSGHCDVADLTKLGRKQWPRKTLRNEIPEYVRADDKYIEVQKRVVYINDMLGMLNEILKQINNRSFLINSAIKWYELTQFSE